MQTRGACVRVCVCVCVCVYMCVCTCVCTCVYVCVCFSCVCVPCVCKVCARAVIAAAALAGTTAALDVFRAHAPRAARLRPGVRTSEGRRVLHIGPDHDSRAIAARPHMYESGLAPLPPPAAFTASSNRHARRMLAKATGADGGGVAAELGAGGGDAVRRVLDAQGAPGADEAGFEAWCRMKFGVVA
jgi:hypothetical protein